MKKSKTFEKQDLHLLTKCSTDDLHVLTKYSTDDLHLLTIYVRATVLWIESPTKSNNSFQLWFWPAKRKVLLRRHDVMECDKYAASWILRRSQVFSCCHPPPLTCKIDDFTFLQEMRWARSSFLAPTRNGIFLSLSPWAIHITAARRQQRHQSTCLITD